MKKIILSGIVAGIILLALSVVSLYFTIWFFPNLAEQYFDPAFDLQESRYLIFFIHPFIISMALAFFWQRFKGVLTGSFITRGIEFGFIYSAVAIFPMMWMIYGAMSVTLAMVATWLLFGLFQSVFAGLIFEKMNP